MAKINVKFVTESRTSKAGNPYQLIEMWVTDREGGWPDRPTISIMPFHARLLLQNLPELCLELASYDGKIAVAEETRPDLPSLMDTKDNSTSEESGRPDPKDVPF